MIQHRGAYLLQTSCDDEEGNDQYHWTVKLRAKNILKSGKQETLGKATGSRPLFD